MNLSSFVSPIISSKSRPSASRTWSNVECRYAMYLSMSTSFFVASSTGLTWGSLVVLTKLMRSPALSSMPFAWRIFAALTCWGVVFV